MNSGDLIDWVLLPFRIIWEVMPPVVAIPVIAITVIFWIGYTTYAINQTGKAEGWKDPYEPGEGYKFDVDDFD